MKKKIEREKPKDLKMNSWRRIYWRTGGNIHVRIGEKHLERFG
jgi:hypothetical protein